jgi:hypothetical protein
MQIGARSFMRTSADELSYTNGDHTCQKRQDADNHQ